MTTPGETTANEEVTHARRHRHRDLVNAVVVVVAGLDAKTVRIVHSGAGGSLLDADGVRYVDTAEFPRAIREESLGQAAALDYYRTTTGVTWTYVSPPPGNFAPGEERGESELASTIRSSMPTGTSASPSRTSRWRSSTRSRRRAI